MDGQGLEERGADPWGDAPDSPIRIRLDGVPLRFAYVNWRKEAGERRARPLWLWHGATEYHPEPQMLVRALDLDKGAVRDFAVADVAPVVDGGAPGTEG